jgi:hypothetical protein
MARVQKESADLGMAAIGGAANAAISLLNKLEQVGSEKPSPPFFFKTLHHV